MRSLITAVMLLYVLVLPVAAMDIVVCINADGHVALEAARNGRCVTPSIPSLASRHWTGIVLPSADYHGPCVDIPLLTGDGREDPVSGGSNFTSSPLPRLALVTSVVVIPTDLPPTPLLVSSPVVCSPALTALRTVVLLI